MRSIILIAGLIPACTIPNPAFDVAASVGAQTGTDAESSGAQTSSAPTTASATGSSGAASITTTDPGAPTTSDATSVGTNTTSASSGTTDETTGEPSTGEPASCWEQGSQGWPIDGAPLDAFQDSKPVDPTLTPDALGLYYIANEPRRVYLSTRATPFDLFPNGMQLVVWGNDPGIVPGYPTVVLGGKELLFSSQDDVYSAKAQPDKSDKFALPLPLTPPSTAKPETVITATADSAVLIVQRADGPPIPLFEKAAPRFYQYTRAALEPGAAYAGGTDVTPPTGPIALAICPTLSPDGLRLFFASTTSDILTEANAGDVVRIFYTTRPERSMPWAAPEPIAIANAGKGVTCPSSVSADGCQLAFHRFAIQEDKYSMHLAARAP